MHELEGSDWENLYSHHVPKDAAPATVDLASDYASVWMGLLNLVVDTGVGLAASGAASRAENWPRILKAVRRAANRKTQTNIVVSGSSANLDPDPDFSVFAITETGGPHADATIVPQTGNASRDALRLIGIINTTGTRKFIDDTSGNGIIALAPGESCWLFGVNNSGTIAWYPFGYPADSLSDYTITTSPQTITPTGRVLRLAGTVSAGSIVRLAENDAAYFGKHVVVINNNSNPLLIGPSGKEITVPAGGSAVFYYDSDLGSGSKWMPVGPRTTSHILEGSNLYYTQGRFDSAFSVAHGSATAKTAITVDYRDAGGSVLSAALGATHRIISGLVHFTIPYLTVADMDSDEIYITQAGNTALPTSLLPLALYSDHQTMIPVYGTLNGTVTTFRMGYDTGGRIRIRKADFSAFGTDDAVEIFRQSVQYEGQ